MIILCQKNVKRGNYELFINKKGGGGGARWETMRLLCYVVG